MTHSDTLPIGLKWEFPLKNKDFEQMAELAESTTGPWNLEKIR